MLDFEGYVKNITRQTTVETVFRQFTEAMSQLGFDTVSFQTLTGFGDCQTSLVSGRGKDTTDVYINPNHPLFKQALEQKGPFFEISGEMCIPLRGVGGSFAVIRATESTPSESQRSTVLGFANAIASIFYTQLCSLVFDHRNSMQLTRKERHILKLVSNGHTKASIADSLDVTSHAIDFHFRNILRKHDTSRIVVAVAESIRSGAI